MFRLGTWLYVCPIVMCLCALEARAQANWQSLADIQPGTKVQVVETSLKSTSGTWVSFSETGITLRAQGQETLIPRERVYRVSIRGKNRKRNVLIGLAIGAGAGAGLGVATHQVVREAGVIPGMAAAWGGIGAGIGALVPAAKTVYRAELPRQTAQDGAQKEHRNE